MKFIFVGLLLALSVQTHAAITDIKVTSFRAIGDYPKDKSAELCGHVTFQDEKLVQVIATVDPKQNPANYSTFTDPKGGFCVVVATYTGQAVVSALSQISGSSVSMKTPQNLTK